MCVPWGQRAGNMGVISGQYGNHMWLHKGTEGVTWESPGDNVRVTWGSQGSKMGVTWEYHGCNMRGYRLSILNLSRV